MKKFFIFLFFIVSTLPVFCEAIKLKNGLIINGSIIDRTEYVLKVQTSYGLISLNQREVEKIMPDLHRILLKGGGEYVGTVVDLDEFNLSLNTDSGLVNIDVSQITSMEIYDYEEAAKQKKYVENKIEQETQTAQEEDKKKQAVASNMGASGLSFDDDLEKVFPSKPQETETVKYVYKTHNDTEEQKKTADEEKALWDALNEVEKEQRIKEEALSFDQNRKRKTGKNYFAVQAGLLHSSLQVDLSDLDGPTDFKVSGNNVAIGLAYMRKLTDRFWYGGGFSFAMFARKDAIYQNGLDPKDLRDTEVTGEVYDFNALFNFYVNPKDPLRVYLTGGVGLNGVGTSKSYRDCRENPAGSGVWEWGTIEKDDKTYTAFNGNFGIGLEWAIDDINIGLETRFRYMPLKDDLSNSSKTNVFVTLKTSWFF